MRPDQYRNYYVQPDGVIWRGRDTSRDASDRLLRDIRSLKGVISRPAYRVRIRWKPAA